MSIYNVKKIDPQIINGARYELIITRNQINKRYTQLAKQIKEEHPDHLNNPPIFIGVITGGLYPLVDITRELSKIKMDYKVDTIGASRYGNSKKPNKINITKLHNADITNKNVIIVEDVIEEGITLEYINNLLVLDNPSSIKILATGWKKSLSPNFKISYCGFELPEEWLIGEGMDEEQLVRGHLGIWKKIR